MKNTNYQKKQIMLKKEIIVLFGALALVLTSCGGTTPCDCADGLKQMSEDYMEAGEDEAKRESLEKKYEKLNTDCEALSKEMGQEDFVKALEDCQ